MSHKNTTDSRPSAAEPSLGLDIRFTKIVLDFQNGPADGSDEAMSATLDTLHASAGVDAVCLVSLDKDSGAITGYRGAVAAGAACSLEVFARRPLIEFPWLAARLGHLRVLEVLDTRFVSDQMQIDAAQFIQHNIGCALIAGFDVGGKTGGFFALLGEQPRASWDVNLHLLLKLLGSSMANNLQRARAERELLDERTRNELATVSANEGLWEFDSQANSIWLSPRWKSMLGYADADFEQRRPDWQQLLHPDDLSGVQSMMRKHLAGETASFESIHRVRHRDGQWRWMLSRANAIDAVDGAGRRLVGVDLDITERKFFEEALHREKERAQITLQSIGDGVISTDADGRVEYLNPTAEELTGWQLEDAAGRPVKDVFRTYHEETCEPLENPLTVAIRSPRAVKSMRPTLMIRRDGNEIYVESTASSIRNEDGRILGGVLVFHDVSESRELHRRLSFHTSHDMLTGLVNRGEFEKRVGQALQNAAADGDAHYALCYVDIDQFKMVNDTCGHSAGDNLLTQLGDLLKAKIRWRDTLARLGGDEFGLLLESCALDEAVDLAETLREVVESFRFTWDDRVFRLGASIGVVPITPDVRSVADLLSAADSACAVAKESGRNRVHVFQENDLDLMRRRREMQWAARINNALEESRFELFRQVIRPLKQGEDGDHYELLLRLRDEKGKLIPPGEFLASAERYNLMPSIDRWVLTHAFKWLLDNDAERERLAVCSINLSGQSLGDDKFLPFVIERLQTTGLNPATICFEITETAAIASYTQASHFISALKNLGCRFALDDFGTGLSSFGYLKHFPVDYLKIDGSFVKGILADPIDREMVRAINEIGHLTGKQTIAEFAENDEIIAMLVNMGVDFAQGFGVGEPRRLERAA